MQSLKFLFELTGTITRPDNELYSLYTDNQLVDILNNESSYIKTEIEQEIQAGLKQFLKIHHPKVDISFENGSILATGFVVIDILGKTSGAIAFFEYVNRLVKRVTERAIRNSLRKKIQNDRFTISIQTIPMNIPESSNQTSEQDGSSTIFNIPSSKLLIYITLINIMFFIGGTLFNLFQVDSVQKRYNEANQKYLEVKANYDSTSQLVAHARIKYQADMESLFSDLMTKKRAILSSLSSDTISISSDISLLKAKSKRLDLEIESTNKAIANNQQTVKQTNETIKKEIDKTQQNLNELNHSINKLKDNKTKFGFIDSWNFMNLALKIIVSSLILVSISSAIFIVLVIKKSVLN